MKRITLSVDVAALPRGPWRLIPETPRSKTAVLRDADNEPIAELTWVGPRDELAVFAHLIEAVSWEMGRAALARPAKVPSPRKIGEGAWWSRKKREVAT